jgi:hypothetical protein
LSDFRNKFSALCRSTHGHEDRAPSGRV